MTRLAIQHKAVNLSQGFPNEPPPWELRLACAHAILTGQPEPGDDSRALSVQDLQGSLVDLLGGTSNTNTNSAHNLHYLDQLNQYSPPMGRPDLRSSIAKYYQRFYQYNVSPDDITVTLGATEAFASGLRTVGRPGDKCVIFEPFHELYPSQCHIFYLEPVYVTLRPSEMTGTVRPTWQYDHQELEDAMKEARVLLLNTPHNPTGKVFSKRELEEIVKLCLKYDVYLITDDIYEHILWQPEEEESTANMKADDPPVQHWLLPKAFPEMIDQTLVCNSLGKSASATGWRVGWCLHPPHLSERYRGIHDQLAVMAPHPMQYATLSYLTLPDAYFVNLAARYQQRVKKLAQTLQRVGFQVIFPQGAYYLFVNYRRVPQLASMTSMEASMFLLKEVGVACVPGDNFYGKSLDDTNNCYLRFAACRSDGDLDEAIVLLERSLGNS